MMLVKVKQSSFLSVSHFKTCETVQIERALRGPFLFCIPLASLLWGFDAPLHGSITQGFNKVPFLHRCGRTGSACFGGLL